MQELIENMLVSPETFAELGSALFRSAAGMSRIVRDRRFRSLFGIAPRVCSRVWSLVGSQLPKRASPQHLLWALLFLKIYASESVNAVLSKADEKTFRKWQCIFVKKIASLQVVSRCNFIFQGAFYSYF